MNENANLINGRRTHETLAYAPMAAGASAVRLSSWMCFFFYFAAIAFYLPEIAPANSSRAAVAGAARQGQRAHRKQ